MQMLLAIVGVIVIGLALIGFVRALWRAPGGPSHDGHDPISGGTQGP